MRKRHPGSTRTSGPKRRPGFPLGGRSNPISDLGPMSATDKRPADKGMDHGTPASEAFKFPMREKLPVKDAD